MSVHFILQGKGGVGKSYISALLAQFLLKLGKQVRGIDTDPNNQTFAGYKKLGATHLNIMRDNNKIDESVFDMLIEQILADRETTWVIDNGATTFNSISNYIVENKVFDLFAEENIPVFVHSVVTGGQALVDTLRGLDSIASAVPAVTVWENEFFGPVLANGKPLKEMKAFTTHKNKINGCIKLQKLNQDTFGADVCKMIERKLTFDEAMGEFGIMAKRRLKTVQDGVFSQLAAVYG